VRSHHSWNNLLPKFFQRHWISHGNPKSEKNPSYIVRMEVLLLSDYAYWCHIALITANQTVEIDLHVTSIKMLVVAADERALLAVETASLMPQTDVVSWEFSNHSAETAVHKNAVVGLMHWKSRQLA